MLAEEIYPGQLLLGMPPPSLKPVIPPVPAESGAISTTNQPTNRALLRRGAGTTDRTHSLVKPGCIIFLISLAP